MKAAMVFLVVSLRAAVAIAVATGYESNVAKFSSGSRYIEPALAPMPAPAPSKEAFHIDFEITNLNYFDLSKEVCTDKPDMVNQAHATDGGAEHPHEQQDVVDEFMGHIDGFSDQISGVFNGVKDTVEDVAGTNFLQVRHGREDCKTVMELMKKSIEDAIKDVIYCFPPEAIKLQGGPAPAVFDAASSYDIAVPSGVAAAPSPSFLQIERRAPPVMFASGPSPGLPQVAALSTQDAAAAIAKDVTIFVSFSPGQTVGSGKATKVDIALADKAGGLQQAMLAAMPGLKLAVASGMLKQKVSSFISAAVGIVPEIGKIDTGMQKTEQWPIAKCEKHIKDIVGHFAVHYTREQVPRALYNECTNFMTKISFSNDYVLDPLDTRRCKKATAKFTEEWNYGKNVDPEDFQSMCIGACEAKYGRHALQCDVK